MAEVDITQLVNAVEHVLATRLQGIRAEIDNLRMEVGEAVSQIRDTAQVLHDNDTALMAQFLQSEHVPPGEVVMLAHNAWERFVRGECEQLGWRIVVPKGAASDRPGEQP